MVFNYFPDVCSLMTSGFYSRVREFRLYVVAVGYFVVVSNLGTVVSLYRLLPLGNYYL